MISFFSTSSEDSDCTKSEFSFRLSNTDLKTNKCYLENNGDDMVWISASRCKINKCNDDQKNAYLTLETIDDNYMLWPHGMDEIFLSWFNRLVFHYKRYSLLNRPYKMFFMRNRQINGNKYIHSNNMLYGAIHMTIKYLCCYTETELLQIMKLLQTFEWEPFQISLKKLICLYSNDEIHFQPVFDTQSEILLKKWTFKFEKYMVKHNINVTECRKDFEPFHISFISIKYYNDELIWKNKQNILNNAITYIQDINNIIVNNDYNLTIEINKDIIIHNLFIVSKGSQLFDFNHRPYIGVSSVNYHK